MISSWCDSRPSFSLWRWSFLLMLLATHYQLTCSDESTENAQDEPPHVFMGILVRNQAHTLANFFGYIEKLDYPKNKITVW